MNNGQVGFSSDDVAKTLDFKTYFKVELFVAVTAKNNSSPEQTNQSISRHSCLNQKATSKKQN